MKTTYLKSLTLVAVTASIYAITVAFTSVGSHTAVGRATLEFAAPKTSTIEQWVTRRLGYPHLLDRSEEVVPVVIRLHVDAHGRVGVVQCETSYGELVEYITAQLNGQYASIDTNQFNRDFEIKINFRHM